MASGKYLFTSEAVSMGHPDKLADQLSDAVLDSCFTQDPYSRVACETMVKTGMVILAGDRAWSIVGQGPAQQLSLAGSAGAGVDAGALLPAGTPRLVVVPQQFFLRNQILGVLVRHHLPEYAGLRFDEMPTEAELRDGVDDPESENKEHE